MISKSDFNDAIDFEFAIQASRLYKEIIKDGTFDGLMEIIPGSQEVRDDVLFINGRYCIVLESYMNTSRVFAVFNHSAYYYIITKDDRIRIERGEVPVVVNTSQGYIFDFG